MKYVLGLICGLGILWLVGQIIGMILILHWVLTNG